MADMMKTKKIWHVIVEGYDHINDMEISYRTHIEACDINEVWEGQKKYMEGINVTFLHISEVKRIE